MKRILPFVLFAVMMLSLLYGCSSSKPINLTEEQHQTDSQPTIQEPTKEISLPKLGVGQVVQMENFGEYTLKSAMLYDDIQVGLLSLDKKAGVKRLVFIFDGKNLTNQDLNPSDFINIAIPYKDNYTYKTDSYMGFAVPDSNSFPPALMPLKASIIYCIVEIPDEVALSVENMKTTIKLKDQEYQYGGVIENAYQYINQMRDINANLEKAVDDLSSTTMDMRFTLSITQEDIVRFGKRFAEQKVLVDGVKDSLTKIAPPAYYQEGHASLVKGIDFLQVGLESLAIEDVNGDLASYGDIVRGAGQQITEAGTNIDQAKEKLDFLSW